ncbi:hypothetical protein GS426_17015 [Rhodococcus hoagii]|nr:hypothetical protein [Prescottella equi]
MKIFRVDNPHTKPPSLWEWLIAEVKRTDPDVLFLSEAFTRPARLYGLAKRGFTQSYTYFTWRVHKWELTEFGNEIAAKADEARPNLFVNTPDILHESCSTAGRDVRDPGGTRRHAVAHVGRVLGVRVVEHVAVRPGSEEYLDSEKYQLRPRDFARGPCAWRVTRTVDRDAQPHPARASGAAATAEPAFPPRRQRRTAGVLEVRPVTGDAVLTVVNLDPFGAQQGFVALDMPAIGRDWHDHLSVHDKVSGEQYEWGQHNFVRLEPWRACAHILTLPHIPFDARRRLADREHNP